MNLHCIKCSKFIKKTILKRRKIRGEINLNSCCIDCGFKILKLLIKKR